MGDVLYVKAAPYLNGIGNVGQGGESHEASREGVLSAAAKDIRCKNIVFDLAWCIVNDCI